MKWSEERTITTRVMITRRQQQFIVQKCINNSINNNHRCYLPPGGSNVFKFTSRMPGFQQRSYHSASPMFQSTSPSPPSPKSLSQQLSNEQKRVTETINLGNMEEQNGSEQDHQQDHSSSKNGKGQEDRSEKRKHSVKRIFGIAFLSALSVPIVIGVLGRMVSEWLNSKADSQYEQALKQLDIQELRSFLLNLITKEHANFLSQHVGDATQVKFVNDAVLMESSKTLYLSAILCKKSPVTGEDECYSAPSHLKGVCHLYFPIHTQKGGALVKLTLVSGEPTEDGSKLQLHKYRALVIPVKRLPNLKALSEYHSKGLEEENMNHVSLTPTQLYEFFGEYATSGVESDHFASPSKFLSLTCVTLKKDLMIFESSDPPGGYTKRDFRVLEYTKHSDPIIVKSP